MLIDRFTYICSICGYSHIFYVGKPDKETVYKYHDEGSPDKTCRFGIGKFHTIQDTISEEEFNKLFHAKDR